MRPGVLFPLLLALVAPQVPPSVFAQEVGVAFATGRSDHPELPGPAGFSAFALVELDPAWLIQISFHRLTDESDKVGIVCRTYSPRIGCAPADTHTEVALSGLRGGLLRALPLGDHLRIGVGGGLSFNHVDGTSQGVSGQLADLLVPNGGQIGAFGTFSAAVTPVPRVPVRILGRFNLHWVNFNACSGEDPPQYDPFCEPGSVRELEVGVSYSF